MVSGGCVFQARLFGCWHVDRHGDRHISQLHTQHRSNQLGGEGAGRAGSCLVGYALALHIPTSQTGAATERAGAGVSVVWALFPYIMENWEHPLPTNCWFCFQPSISEGFQSVTCPTYEQDDSRGQLGPAGPVILFVLSP